MASDHPFQTLFETFGKLPSAHAEPVNRRAFVALGEALSVPVESTGRCILLRAPRAGHGKTHLLSRLQHQLAATHEFIPLYAVSGSRIDAASVTDDALRRLLRQLPASAGLSVLDLMVRRLFASALQPLVKSGEVPCQDREGALTALRNRPIETFDFHHPNAVTAHWARENFEVLGPRLSLELSQRAGLPIREVSFWVEALFRFAATPADQPERVRALGEAVLSGPEGGAAMERLAALLGLVALLVRVVLVADELEGFSAEESAALKFAAFLGSLRQSVDPLDVIISLNQDIWQSAFVPRLSGGLTDRLSEVVVDLEPLTEAEMVRLLESRVPGLGAEVLDHVDLHKAGNHPRGLLRAAAAAWIEAVERRGSQGKAAATPPPLAPDPMATAATPSEPAVADVPSLPPSPFSSGSEPDSVRSSGDEPKGEPSEDAANSDYQIDWSAKNEEPPPRESDGVPPEMADLPEPGVSSRSEASQDDEFAMPHFGEAVESHPQPGGAQPPPLRDPTPEEADRVDDLLRQFRERYGRGSL